MRRTTLHGFALTLTAVTALLAAPARANEASCAPQQARLEANTWVTRIATAPSLDEARDLALQPTRGAHSALAKARLVAPWSDSLAKADDDLVAYEGRISGAASAQAVADEAAHLVNGGIYGDIDGGCSFSTGEVIATVIGFILGVLPGIILMILLC